MAQVTPRGHHHHHLGTGRLAIRIVRLGTPRLSGEGLRIGTVRRPPRGVPKAEFAKRDYYDVWFPVLSPSAETLKLGLHADNAKEWAQFIRRFRGEMSRPDASAALDLLAALSHAAHFSLGCYCADESGCHRSVLRDLLVDRGASMK
jgi:uncharacterized protein YeaO (DUF488 family)